MDHIKAAQLSDLEVSFRPKIEITRHQRGQLYTFKSSWQKKRNYLLRFPWAQPFQIDPTTKMNGQGWIQKSEHIHERLDGIFVV